MSDSSGPKIVMTANDCSSPTAQDDQTPQSSIPIAPPLPPRIEVLESPYIQKLMAARMFADDNILTQPPTEFAPPAEYSPTYYFFYGTLQDPTVLSHILDLETSPTLRPAKIIYELANWGQYKALVDGPPGNEVHGSVYYVDSIEAEYKLARYEGNAYKLAPCRMRVTDGEEPSEVDGDTFKYAGDAAAL